MSGKEPVIVGAAISNGLAAIWGVLVIVFQVDSTLAGAVAAGIATVVGSVVTVVTRGKVTPEG